jgi:hypothetical protein
MMGLACLGEVFFSLSLCSYFKVFKYVDKASEGVSGGKKMCSLEHGRKMHAILLKHTHFHGKIGVVPKQHD